VTYRIARSIEPGAIVFALSGVLETDLAAKLEARLASELNGGIVLDLKDVTLVDRAAVRFLARVEATGTAIVNCPEYVRIWMTAENDSQ
jgi:anti-anti-sigma regulatory factor